MLQKCRCLVIAHNSPWVNVIIKVYSNYGATYIIDQTYVSKDILFLNIENLRIKKFSLKTFKNFLLQHRNYTQN